MPIFNTLNPLEYLLGPVEAAATMGSGMASMLASVPYAEINKLTPEQQQAWMAMHTYQPRTQVGQDITGLLGKVGEFATDTLKLPPVMPEAQALAALSANPAAIASQAGRAAVAAKPAIGSLLDQIDTAVVPRAYAVPPQRRGASMSKSRVGTTGQYVGAPAGIDSPQKLSAMRKSYMDQALAGIPGREWYQDASNWIQQVASPGQEDAIARALGISSQGTGVDTNLGFTVKAANQAAAGLPIETGRFPGNQSPLIQSSFQGSTDYLGPKRQPFASNLAVNWDPAKAQHPVHDIWQGRAFGYTNAQGKPWDAGFSSQQHAFMDKQMAEINKQLNAKAAGGFTDWDPLRTQAAAWTGAKIKAGDLSPADAAMQYGDFSPKYQAMGTYEQTPGVGTGHLEGLANMPYQTREQFSNAAPWLDEKGRDTIYGAANMLVEPTQQSVGAYTPAGTGSLEVNPAAVARPLVQTAGGKMLPEGSLMMDIGESARAYTDVQNAGAWHKVIPNTQTQAGERSSLTIPMSGSPTQEQMVKLDAFAKKNGMFAVDTGNGVNLINDPWSDVGAKRTGTTLAKELKGDFGKELNKITGNAPGERVKIESGYQDYEGAWAAGQGSGQATSKFLDDLEKNSEFSSRIEPALRRQAAANMKRDEAFAASRGIPLRDDVQMARKILSEQGIAGLKDALKKGALLPAVVGIVLNDDQQSGDSLMGMF